MSKGFQAYRQYLIFKLAFSGKYDISKYGMKLNQITEATYLKRKDQYIFEKLASKHPQNLKGFLIANFSRNPHLWVGDLLDEEAQERYYEWLKIKQSFTYIVTNELKNLTRDDIRINNGFHPKALMKHIGKKLSLEALCVLFDMTGIDLEWDIHLKEDPIWKEVYSKVSIYRKFLHYDFDKIYEAVKENIDGR